MEIKGIGLDTDIQFLKGVGPKMAELLSKLGIYKIKDLMEKKKNAELSEKTNAELFRSRLQQVEAKYQPFLTELYSTDNAVDWNAYVEKMALTNELTTEEEIKKHMTEQGIDESFISGLETQLSDNLVDRDMFEAINSANNARRESDKMAQDYEKQITKLKEMNDIGKKKS